MVIEFSSGVVFASRTVCSRDAAAEHTGMYLLRVQEENMTSERHQESMNPLYCSL
jgi:hypothetical protein